MIPVSEILTRDTKKILYILQLKISCIQLGFLKPKGHARWELYILENIWGIWAIWEMGTSPQDPEHGYIENIPKLHLCILHLKW